MVNKAKERGNQELALVMRLHKGLDKFLSTEARLNRRRQKRGEPTHPRERRMANKLGFTIPRHPEMDSPGTVEAVKNLRTMMYGHDRNIIAKAMQGGK